MKRRKGVKTLEEAISRYNTKAPIGMRRWIAKRGTFVANWATQTGKFFGITVGPVSSAAYRSAVEGKTESEMVGSVTDKGRKCLEGAKAGLQV